MSISGSLEDVSVADVMQFIHLGRRTGTLMLRRGGEDGRIGFHEGRLVSARGPNTKKLGDLLVDTGTVERRVLEEAAEVQAQEPQTRSLGQILLSQGALDPDALKKVVSSQIEQTVSELVTWETGTFEFAVDDLTPVDEIALFPGDLVPGTDMNTQMVLLEAARIFDERNRGGEPRAEDGERDLDDTHPVLEGVAVEDFAADEPRPDSQVEPPLDDLEERLEELGKTPIDKEALSGCSLHLVSPDRDLYRELVEGLPVASVEQRRLSDAGKARGQQSPGSRTIILVDLRRGVATLSHVAEVHSRSPAIPIIALVDRVVPVSQVYAAGALAAVPAEVNAVVSCVHNVLQNQQQLARISATTTGRSGPLSQRSGAGVARLRRVFGDLRSGLLSATVALNLMHIISESVERAVLFLVRQDCLQALGAFGVGASGSPLAELTRGMRLDPDQPTVLTDSLNSGETVATRFSEAILPENLKEVLGRPLNGQIVVFPVLGAQRVISVIYTDNGQIDRPIEDIEILELATAQVGMAFENELLRRQIARQKTS